MNMGTAHSADADDQDIVNEDIFVSGGSTFVGGDRRTDSNGGATAQDVTHPGGHIAVGNIRSVRHVGHVNVPAGQGAHIAVGDIGNADHIGHTMTDEGGNEIFYNDAQTVVSNVTGNVEIANIDGALVVDGVYYAGPGLSVRHGKIYRNGVVIGVIQGTRADGTGLLAPVHIVINGNVGTVSGAIASVQCQTAEKVDNMNGDVTVQGSVAGKVECHNGKVTISGDVQRSVSTMNAHVTVEGSIKGNIDTMNGNVIRRPARRTREI